MFLCYSFNVFCNIQHMFLVGLVLNIFKWKRNEFTSIWKCQFNVINSLHAWMYDISLHIHWNITKKTLVYDKFPSRNSVLPHDRSWPITKFSINRILCVNYNIFSFYNLRYKLSSNLHSSNSRTHWANVSRLLNNWRYRWDTRQLIKWYCQWCIWFGLCF